MAIIDVVDASAITPFRWFALRVNKSGNDFYAARNKERINGVKGGAILMHRVILSAEGLLTDHRSRNTLDNRRSNLRLATKSQNNANSKQKLSLSGIRGVYRHGLKWYSSITHNGKCIHLGGFMNKHEAANAYNLAAKKLHGAFCVLNQPQESK